MRRLKPHTEYSSNTMKAIAYRRELKAEKRKNIATGILTIGLLTMLVGCVGNSDFETEIAEGSITYPRETYIICDVDETEVGTEDETIIAVIMQDGSIHDYIVIDAPEGNIDEVCFKANDLDDYESYEIVALR